MKEFPRLHVKPNYKVVSEGDSVKFVCKYEKEVEWTFNEGKLPSNTKLGKVPQTSWSFLKIKKVCLENSGIYKCFSKNNIHIFGKGVLKVKSKL